MHRGCKASKAQRKIALRRLLDGASMWTRHGGAEHGVGSQLSIVEARGHQVLDVIDFLETLGQDAQLRYASRDEVGFALAGAEMEPALQVAILSKNGLELQALLGQRPFCCLINPAKPEEEQEECDGNCKEGEEKKRDEERREKRDGD